MIESRKEMRGQGGFTLIELLVVVAILAILAGVAVFAVSNLTKDADENACKVERDTIKTAIAAQEATSSANDTYGDYLDGTPKYFELITSPTDNGNVASDWQHKGTPPANCPSV